MRITTQESLSDTHTLNDAYLGIKLFVKSSVNSRKKEIILCATGNDRKKEFLFMWGDIRN